MTSTPAPATVVPSWVRRCARCRAACIGLDLCDHCRAVRRAEVQFAEEIDEAVRPFSAFLADRVQVAS